MITSYKSIKLSKADLDNNKSTNATRSIPIFSISSGLNFDSDKTRIINNTAFLQTLEPRAYYFICAKTQSKSITNF